MKAGVLRIHFRFIASGSNLLERDIGGRLRAADGASNTPTERREVHALSRRIHQLNNDATLNPSTATRALESPDGRVNPL